jgi:hypothetical protein
MLNLKTTEGTMDHAQYKAFIEIIKSLIRILIYILAVLVGGLCYAIGRFEHLSGFWLFLYPTILVFIVLSELRVAGKKNPQGPQG